MSLSRVYLHSIAQFHFKDKLNLVFCTSVDKAFSTLEGGMLEVYNLRKQGRERSMF